MSMKRTWRLLLLPLCGAGLLTGNLTREALRSAGAANAAVKAPANGDEMRNYDARIEFNKGFKASRASRLLAAEALAQKTPELSLTFDETTGAVASLSNHVGYLSAAKSREDALTVALDYVQQNLAVLGLEESDLAEYEVTDRVYSKVTGATHIYLRQVCRGIPVYNGQLHINVNRDGRVISVNNAFVPGISRITAELMPAIDLGGAVEKAAAHLGIPLAGTPAVVKEAEGVVRKSAVDQKGISREKIEGQLMWLPIREGMVRLVWNFQVHTLDKQHMYDLTVDENGVWTRFDWTSSDSYRVYARPAESPNHASPPAPADGRTLVTNPANSTASPFGWHDTNGAAGAEFTTTQGNNVQAYTDTDANDAPDAGSSPGGGAGLNFDFPLSLATAPSAYRPAAVTNLFYWTNILHDVQYQYGFDEAAGNFQVNNYGRGGLGNDSLQAEAQDGFGTNNANFGTPPDGSRPRMQMFIWTAPTPDRDGDLDSGIVIHEYGHGISTRLVGGPSNSSCLTNRQQPGEGLSDWWTLAYTAKAGDTGPLPRGVGTYALNQALNGPGIRTQRYSTDPLVNNWTYASINGAAVPHGVGAVWAQAAWEVYWKLVDAHGFDANLYNANGNAGNQRMMLYVTEGLKNTACNPTFTQVRDGIIQAAMDNHGGEDVCRMWEAFAAYGLGTNAVSGGAASTTPTNGFAVPASCQGGNPTVVFQDTFETNLGWTTNPNGTDTATTGQWERGDPEATNSGGAKQLGTTVSGVNDLVTGRLAGASAGAADIDGGVTTIRSPAITLPATGNLTLSFSFYLAHGTNATNADFLRVRIVGATTVTVFERLGSATNVNGAWSTGSASLNAFAGQTVRIQIEAADAATASLVEAGIDDVRVTRQ
jgi:extracellular elastinolytic metalloproteinase